MLSSSENLPIQLGIFETLDSAAAAVKELKSQGFSSEEISVVAAGAKAREEFDPAVTDQQPAGSNTASALDKAGLGALGLGAVAVAAGVLSSAGTAVMLVGAAAGVSIAGTFVAAMLTRGAEHELADYYDQALTAGQILVGVEPRDASRIPIASDVLEHSGAVRTDALPSEKVIS